MKIKNKEYKLSPRRTQDYLNLLESSRSLFGDQQNSDISNLLLIATALADSLKSTAMELSFFARLRYRKFYQKRGVHYLLNNMSVLELVEAHDELAQIESVKKKVKNLGKQSQSEDKLRKVS